MLVMYLFYSGSPTLSRGRVADVVRGAPPTLKAHDPPANESAGPHGAGSARQRDSASEQEANVEQRGPLTETSYREIK